MKDRYRLEITANLYKEGEYSRMHYCEASLGGMSEDSFPSFVSRAAGTVGQLIINLIDMIKEEVSDDPSDQETDGSP